MDTIFDITGIEKYFLIFQTRPFTWTPLVSPLEVFEELSSLNPHKAYGLDQICPCLLKEGAKIIASPLAELFNKSLNDGVLPLDWVSANVTPVFKKGD